MKTVPIYRHLVLCLLISFQIQPVQGWIWGDDEEKDVFNKPSGKSKKTGKGKKNEKPQPSEIYVVLTRSPTVAPRPTTHPTPRPIVQPTHLPSARATNIPTRIQSLTTKPSQSPVMSIPTLHPMSFQTPRPTDQPINIEFPAPTQDPDGHITTTGSPTRLVTFNPPTLRPSIDKDSGAMDPAMAVEPTRSPVIQNQGSQANEVITCSSEGNLFGSADGQARFLEYAYELETDLNDIAGSLSSVVLPPLEIAFNDFLLPVLFPQTCSDTSIASRRRRLRAVGLSATPADEPRPEVACTETVEPGNTCVFIRGSLIVFVDENEDISTYEQIITDRLALGMDNDVFLPAHPSIARLTFVETDVNGNPATEAPESSRDISADVPEESDESNNDLVLPLVLAAAGCVVIATGVILTRRISG